jgi:hypothetical protein
MSRSLVPDLPKRRTGHTATRVCVVWGNCTKRPTRWTVLDQRDCA